MVNQYKAGNIKQEDAPAMKDLLTKFDKHKDKLSKKRIEQYKSHGELNSALMELNPEKSKREQQSEKEQQIVKEGSTLVHSSDNMNLHHVHNTEASKVLGKGMPWCTSRQDCNNMFPHYNAMSGGRFYVAHMHNEKPPFRKLGIGVGAGEFQDENNEKISGQRLKELVERNPELKSIPHLQGTSVHTTEDHNKHIHSLLDNNPEETLKHMRENPEKYNKESHDAAEEYNQHMNLAQRGDSSVKNSRYNSVKKTLAERTKDSGTLEHLSTDINPAVRSQVAKNRNSTNNTRFKLANDPVNYVRGSTNIHDFNDDQINHIMQEKHPDVLTSHHNKLAKRYMKGSVKLNPEHLDAIVKNPNATEAHAWLAQEHVYSDKELSPEHIKAIVNNPDATEAHKSLARGHAAGKINLDNDHIKAIVNNPNSIDAHDMLAHGHVNGKKELSPEHINTIVNNPKSIYAHEHLKMLMNR